MPHIRLREDRTRWWPGHFVNDEGHPRAPSGTREAQAVRLADALIYYSMRR